MRASRRRSAGGNARRAPLAFAFAVLVLAALGGSLQAQPARAESAPPAPPAPPAAPYALDALEALAPADPVARAIARRFAPEVRYNAWVDDHPSDQNRNEDFFPASVEALFAWMEAGRYPIVVRRSEGPTPAIVRWLDAPRGSIEPERMHFPDAVAGLPPGEAPFYVHVYELDGARRARAEGGFASAWRVEHWRFYAYDWTCSRMLGRFGCKGAHRGDWEHTSFRVEGVVTPAGALGAARITEGIFYAHGWGVRVLREEGLEFVDDDGAPGGEHPVVYVSAGKHGSFPQAGELHDFAGVSAVADHDDFFRGNGVRIRGWRVPLIDIAPATRAAHPERFAPPALASLTARAAPPFALEAWLDYQGRWGADLEGVFGVHWTASATGPYAKRSFGDGGRATYSYAAFKARFGSKLRVYASAGREAPPVDPAPVPRWPSE